MTLSFEKLGKSSVPIANLYEEGEQVNQIFHTDDDDLNDPKFKKLMKIRLNDKDKSFFPIITDFFKTEQTQKIYVSGASGCGKSTFIREYVLHFLKKYGVKSNILLFSSKKEDKALDDLKLERVQIDEDIFANPYTLSEIAGTGKPVLTIFDDIEDFSTKKITKEIERLRDEIMRNGRSYGIFCIYVHHDPCDYKSTKSQLFEANMVVIFPKRSGVGTYNYLLDNKLHLGKKNIDLINTLKSNYVCISKNIPQSIISDKYILLL
jgi:hypothetical protein